MLKKLIPSVHDILKFLVLFVVSMFILRFVPAGIKAKILPSAM